MRTTESKRLSETSLVRDRAMSMPTTPKNPVPMIDGPRPELIARVRASLAAMRTKMMAEKISWLA